MSATFSLKVTSMRHLRQLQVKRPDSSITSDAISDLVQGEDFYQQLKSFSNTIISVQYNKDELLSFKVSQVERGEVVYSNTQPIGLRCLLGGKTYTFKREHLDLMSNRECRELFDHLGVDDSLF